MKQQTCLRRIITFARTLNLRVEFGRENAFYTTKYPKYGNRRVKSDHTIVVEFSPYALMHDTIDQACVYAGAALAHELGHYLIAPKGRRHRKDYGIPAKQRTSASIDKWQLDDDKAVMVELQLLKHFSFHTSALRRQRVNPDAVVWWYKIGKKMVSDVLKSTREVRAKRMRAGARRRSRARKIIRAKRSIKKVSA